MDDSFSSKQLEALEEGVGKPTDERCAKSLEVVLLDQLIQIHSGGRGERGVGREGGRGVGREGGRGVGGGGEKKIKRRRGNRKRMNRRRKRRRRRRRRWRRG